jgi:hypothetical protein
VCCLTGSTLACTDPFSCTSGIPLACTATSDCAAGLLCCFDKGGDLRPAMAFCGAPPCWLGPQLCQSDAECPAGEKCRGGGMLVTPVCAGPDAGM